MTRPLARPFVSRRALIRRENRAALRELAEAIVKLEEIRRAETIQKIEELPGKVWAKGRR